MDADQKALHDAVLDLLSARRGIKRAAQALRRAGSWPVGSSGWEGLHLINQLEQEADNADAALKRAEKAVLTQWEAFNHESQRSANHPEPDLERLP